MHVCIDDASRSAATGIYPDEQAVSAIACLRAAVAWYQSLGITVARVMTDKGSCYRSFAFAAACNNLKLKHIRTTPYTPRTNGKAERFIQTALRESAHARACQTSEQRKSHLPDWTHICNWHRPHGSLNSKPPITRLGLTRDNLSRFHSATIADALAAGIPVLNSVTPEYLEQFAAFPGGMGQELAADPAVVLAWCRAKA